MNNHNEPDVSSYTMGDLLAAIMQWQLDVDQIFNICEDLPPDAIETACTIKFGRHAGDQLLDMMVYVYNLVPVDKIAVNDE